MTVVLPDWVESLVGGGSDVAAESGALIGSLLDIQQVQPLNPGGIVTFGTGGVDVASSFSTTPSGETDDFFVARRVAGFAGVKIQVLNFDPKKIETFAFPVNCGNFGRIYLSSALGVVDEFPLRYVNQIVMSNVTHILTSSSLLLAGKLDDYCLVKLEAFLPASVNIQVGFIPVWEWWLVKAAPVVQTTCHQKADALNAKLPVPTGYVPDPTPDEPWRTSIQLSQYQCSNPSSYSEQPHLVTWTQYSGAPSDS